MEIQPKVQTRATQTSALSNVQTQATQTQATQSQSTEQTQTSQTQATSGAPAIDNTSSFVEGDSALLDRIGAQGNGPSATTTTETQQRPRVSAGLSGGEQNRANASLETDRARDTGQTSKGLGTKPPGLESGGLDIDPSSVSNYGGLGTGDHRAPPHMRRNRLSRQEIGRQSGRLNGLSQPRLSSTAQRRAQAPAQNRFQQAITNDHTARSIAGDPQQRQQLVNNTQLSPGERHQAMSNVLRNATGEQLNDMATSSNRTEQDMVARAVAGSPDLQDRVVNDMSPQARGRVLRNLSAARQERNLDPSAQRRIDGSITNITRRMGQNDSNGAERHQLLNDLRQDGQLGGFMRAQANDTRAFGEFARGMRRGDLNQLQRTSRQMSTQAAQDGRCVGSCDDGINDSSQTTRSNQQTQGQGSHWSAGATAGAEFWGVVNVEATGEYGRNQSGQQQRTSSQQQTDARVGTDIESGQRRDRNAFYQQQFQAMESQVRAIRRAQ